MRICIIADSIAFLLSKPSSGRSGSEYTCTHVHWHYKCTCLEGFNGDTCANSSAAAANETVDLSYKGA